MSDVSVCQAAYHFIQEKMKGSSLVSLHVNFRLIYGAKKSMVHLYKSPGCFATLTFKMADGPVLLGLADGNMSENDDKICGWSANKIGGTPVST